MLKAILSNDNFYYKTIVTKFIVCGNGLLKFFSRWAVFLL